MFPGLSCARPETAVSRVIPRIDASFFAFIKILS
jgi:hypothetical protein